MWQIYHDAVVVIVIHLRKNCTISAQSETNLAQKLRHCIYSDSEQTCCAVVSVANKFTRKLCRQVSEIRRARQDNRKVTPTS